MSAANAQRGINRGVAYFIPLVLLAIISYSIYVFVLQLSINYLVNPGPSFPYPARPSIAAGLLVGYFILLLAVLITFFRLLYIVATNPGYLPHGKRWHDRRRAKARRSTSTPDILAEDNEKPSPTTPGNVHCCAGASSPSRLVSQPVPLEDQRSTILLNPPPGLEAYYRRPLFACESDGFPRWCAKCLNWKPDRAHHCSEIGRCVSKLDHFCPWVGGVVSATSFKFFIQFVTYAAMLCLYVMVTLAVYLAEMNSPDLPPGKERMLNVHFLVLIAIAGLLGLFTLGMSGSSIHLVLHNSSTIENFDRRTKVWQLAVYLPDPAAPVMCYSTSAGGLAPAAKVIFPPVAYLERAEKEGAPREESRTFAVLRTLPGQNMWDCGIGRNWRDVMGERWYAWFLPVTRSPLLERSGSESLYPTGRVVRKLLEVGGLDPAGRPRAPAIDGTQGGGRSRPSSGKEAGATIPLAHHSRRSSKRESKRHVDPTAATPSARPLSFTANGATTPITRPSTAASRPVTNETPNERLVRKDRERSEREAQKEREKEKKEHRQRKRIRRERRAILNTESWMLRGPTSPSPEERRRRLESKERNKEDRRRGNGMGKGLRDGEIEAEEAPERPDMTQRANSGGPLTAEAEAEAGGSGSTIDQVVADGDEDRPGRSRGVRRDASKGHEDEISRMGGVVV